MNENRHFGKEIRTISNLMRRELDKSSELRRQKSITGTGGWLLGYLYANRDRDVYQRDVEFEFSVRRATASKVISGMEQKGFIKRESVPHDARLKKLTLTDDGLAIQKEICSEIDSFDGRILSGLTEDESETLFRLLEKVRENIEKP